MHRAWPPQVPQLQRGLRGWGFQQNPKRCHAQGVAAPGAAAAAAAVPASDAAGGSQADLAAAAPSASEASPAPAPAPAAAAVRLRLVDAARGGEACLFEVWACTGTTGFWRLGILSMVG
jgi:hypothetical protein